jgi:hypothetical protein
MINAQITQQQYIEDSVFGWYKVYHFTGARESQTIDNQKSINYFMGYLDEKNSRRMTCLKNNKDKYTNRLLEPAETFAAQVVTALDGLEGNWAVMKGRYVRPTLLKTPLPRSFTLSYDVIVPEHFTWCAKGLVLLLVSENTKGVAKHLRV